MKTYKLFVIIGAVLVILLSSQFFVNVCYLQSISTKDKQIKLQKSCSPVTNGLKFCTALRKLVIHSGDKIILNFSLINEGEKELLVNKYDGSNYSLKITNEKKDSLFTKFEQKLKNYSMSDADFKDFIRSQITNHSLVELKPNQVLNEKIVLSDIYDLTKIGKYYIEITRKTTNPKGEGFIEIPLEKIEIEVR